MCPSVLRYAFDSRANGYGRGEGVASIIIKRLDDALKAGDPIRGIIRGTLSNQDGKTETITSPSQTAQEQLMRSCYQKAGIDPRTVQYVEAHGTGRWPQGSNEMEYEHILCSSDLLLKQHPHRYTYR